MARARVPMERRVLEGTVRAKHRYKAENTPKAVILKTVEDCPDLSKTARTYWPFVRKCLNALPVSAESDMQAIQRMTETYAQVMELQKLVYSRGFQQFYETETKTGIIIRAHPALAELSEADRRLRGYLMDFGLTPASRTKVKGNPDEKPTDPLQDFLK